MKTCVCCKQSKPLSEFNRYARGKDGLYYYCKTCHRLSARTDYHQHKVRRTANRTIARQAKLDRLAAKARAWGLPAPDRRIARSA